LRNSDAFLDFDFMSVDIETFVKQEQKQMPALVVMRGSLHSLLHV
jgi:hypothetical protein